MRIALAQIVASTEPDANLDLVREHVARAKDAGAELVVFPEATMASFTTRSAAVAQPVDGEWARGVRDAAREHGIPVVVGMFTPGADGKARNTLLVVDAVGELVATYDKIHLFDAWGFEESRHMEAGDTPVVVEVGGVRFGLATCYDVRFPELFKHLANAGAEVILVPTSWANGPRKAEQFRALCVARALDSTCFILAAGQADPATVGMEVRRGRRRASATASRSAPSARCWPRAARRPSWSSSTWTPRRSRSPAGGSRCWRPRVSASPCPDMLDVGSPRGGTSPNSPRAGRQQGSVSSVRCAGALARPRSSSTPARRFVGATQ